jgi:signal transduction histidine kinase
MRLRTHLTLLVLVSAAPLALFAGFLVRRDLEAEEDTRRTGTRDTVRALTLAIDRELRTSFSVLETLAAAPALAEGNLRKVHELCATAVLGRKGVWIILFDSNGQQILNSSKPFGSRLPNPIRDTKPPGTDPRYPSLRVGGPELIQRVLATGKPIVSDLFVALDSGEPKIGVAIPVLRSGGVTNVLEMSVEPDTLLQIFRDQDVPATWTASISDERGMILARSVDPQATLGKPVSADLAAQIARAPEGEGLGRTWEGVRVFRTFRRCRVAPWTVAVGVSTELADSRERRALFLLGGGAVLSLALGLAAAWFIGRRISASISQLSRSADAMATGQGAGPELTGVKELLELRRALIAAGERKHAHDQLRDENVDLDRRVRERTAELERTIKELEAFSYSVSHDLRAPLRSMEGFTSILLDQYAPLLDERGRNYLGRVSGAADQMSTLIDRLLDLAQVNRRAVSSQKVDLSAVAQEIAASLGNQAPSRPVTWDIAPGLVATGDPALLRTALENLLDNAWKFTAKHPRGRIEFGATMKDGTRVFFVRDDGAGFDMAHADKLFSPFERLHTKDEFPGTGVGLATIRRIIERHGGRIWAEGSVERGATFFFTLG